MWFCSLFSGSSGNCIYVGDEKTNILVDAGLSGTKIVNSLNEIGISPEKIDALLITHEHRDHIHGAGILSRMLNIPIYANRNTWDSMYDLIGSVKNENINIINTGEAFSIGDIDINSYKTPHDAAEPVGYCFYNSNKKISIATDIGHVSENVYENIKDSDLLLLESNHDVEMLKAGPYPYLLKRRILSGTGHLSNDDAGGTILKLMGNKFMTIILGHLSRQNNYPELAYATVKSILEGNGIDIDKDLKLALAYREQASSFFDVR
ncbi:MAG: MBL fold metallo-hydrolase [Clostridiales bacterium]|nr:MBL fold metallo-hydrolase [Clostridiales bacterium]HBM80556.1 MBL fold metallo-hydrolase [Clostridiaceae bacterium]